MPREPAAPVLVRGPDGSVGREMKSVPVLIRADLEELNEPYLGWERPASYSFKKLLEAEQPLGRSPGDQTISDS